jgi:ATP-binding cassette, subfamily B, bacterial MsbA
LVAPRGNRRKRGQHCGGREDGPDNAPRSQPPSMHNLLQRLKRLAPYFRSSRAGLAATLVGATLMAITEPLVAELLKQLLDRGFNDKSAPLWVVPVAIMALFGVRSVASFLSQYGLAWSANRAVLALRQAMFERLLRAQPTLFASQSASALTNAVVYEVQQGVSLLTSALLTLVRDTLLVLALLGYLLTLNWQLTLFVGLLFPALAYVMRVLGGRLHRVTLAGQKATDELAYVVEENVLAWRVVRVHGAQAAQGSRFAEQSKRLRQWVMKATLASATMTPLTQMLAAVALSAVISMALWQSRGGGATVGAFVAFVGAMLMLVAPLKRLSDVAAPIARGLAAVERGLDLAEITPTEASGAHAPQRAQGHIEVQGVTLRYGATPATAGSIAPTAPTAPSEPTPSTPSNPPTLPALENISLHISAGETVALVGPSGAGKTTLANLLPRFLTPTVGRITLDGVALQDWDLLALRRQMAFVSQDVVLFNDSIAANVALSSSRTPDDEAATQTAIQTAIQEALKAANLWDYVQSLPQGMQTPIGHNGTELSGGQRQRLAIARALYKNAPLLVLDEATSALDNESERAVQQALDRLMQGRTTLVIAHRLSTIEHADRVVVMDAGRIVEQGPPAQLLAQGGLFARLHAMQFRG